MLEKLESIEIDVSVGGKKMPKYTDDEIRNMKITCKIAGEYLGISSMAVSMGMRNNLLPIGFTKEI